MTKENNLIIILIVIAAVIFLSRGFWGSGSTGMMPFGGMWMFGWLFMTLIIVALILFIFWLAKQLQEGKK